MKFIARTIYIYVYLYASAVPLRVKLMVGRTWGSLEPFAADKFKDDACGTDTDS